MEDRISIWIDSWGRIWIGILVTSRGSTSIITENSSTIFNFVFDAFTIFSFIFDGFLPQKKGRQTAFKKMAEEERTVIIYESPHRLIKALEQMKEYFGEERRVSVSRELTKIFEETITGTVVEVLAYFSAKTIKGEIVIVVEGKQEKGKEN